MKERSTVGSKIRTLRESKGIDINTLAERAQIPIRQLELIEADEPLPGLAPLIKISRALGVRLGTFMDDLQELGPVVTKAGSYSNSVRFTNSEEASIVGSPAGMLYHSLSDGKSNKHIEPFIIDLNEGEDIKYTPSSHEGEEFIYVLEGQIEVVYGKNTYILEQGDSIHYDSIVSHHVHGVKNQKSKILAIVYAPF